MLSLTPHAPPRLRAAIIGSGEISQEHLSLLAGKTAMGRLDDRVELIAVCDLSLAAARYGASTYGADACFTDVATMLNASQPDVVHVLTPPTTHRPLVTMCLEAGAHVICEKPITANRPELDALLAVARKHDRKLMESHNYRFNSSIMAMRAAIDRGDLGRVQEVEIRISLPVTDPDGRFGDLNLPSPIHKMPAGVVHDFTTHFGYLLPHLAPDVDYQRVAAAWSRHSDNDIFTFDDLDALLIGNGPDGAVHARLRFDARNAPDTFAVTVRGSSGFAETDLFQPFLRFVRPRPGGAKLSPIVNHVANGASLMRSGVQNFGKKLLQQGPYEGLHRMLDLTYSALAAGAELPVTPHDMTTASDLVDRLLDEDARL